MAASSSNSRNGLSKWATGAGARELTADPANGAEVLIWETEGEPPGV